MVVCRVVDLLGGLKVFVNNVVCDDWYDLVMIMEVEWDVSLVVNLKFLMFVI